MLSMSFDVKALDSFGKTGLTFLSKVLLMMHYKCKYAMLRDYGTSRRAATNIPKSVVIQLKETKCLVANQLKTTITLIARY
jgi:hypothetical protein